MIFAPCTPDSNPQSWNSIDCGKKCAPHNPNGKPFCCDICHAVPVAYICEWKYLRHETNLWHAWHGGECEMSYTVEVARLKADTPKNMLLLACLGPSQCQRGFRALNCRQFPFFPYVTSDYRFIGLAYEWQFEDRCWVISNFSQVTDEYCRQFVRRKRRFPLLHRDGGCYLVSPSSEHLQPIDSEHLPRFGFYQRQ